MVATETKAAIVPRLWPESTIVCLGTGPSLCADDVDYCRGRARVIAIKNAVDLAPWADVVYGAGGDSTRWWQRNGDRVASMHAGLRFTLDPAAARWATLLKMGSPAVFLSASPDTLALGNHSGYQAINLAVHLGAQRIVLLGYDMQPTGDRHHFHAGHPSKTHPMYRDWLPNFERLVTPLAGMGVAVVNASRVTAIETFPKMSLSEALS